MTARDRERLLALLRERLPGHTVTDVLFPGPVVRVSKRGREVATAWRRYWYDREGNRHGPYTGRGYLDRMATDITAAVRDLTGGEG